jgi:hypothetical protein
VCCASPLPRIANSASIYPRFVESVEVSQWTETIDDVVRTSFRSAFLCSLVFLETFVSDTGQEFVSFAANELHSVLISPSFERFDLGMVDLRRVWIFKSAKH